MQLLISNFFSSPLLLIQTPWLLILFYTQSWPFIKRAARRKQSANSQAPHTHTKVDRQFLSKAIKGEGRVSLLVSYWFGLAFLKPTKIEESLRPSWCWKARSEGWRVGSISTRAPIVHGNAFPFLFLCWSNAVASLICLWLSSFIQLWFTGFRSPKIKHTQLTLFHYVTRSAGYQL